MIYKKNPRTLLPVKATKLLPFVFCAVFALSRIPGVLPHNFSVAYALAFCAGVYFAGAMAWWLPMGTLVLTNVLLNLFCYHAPVFDSYMIVTLLSFAALIRFGKLFSPRTSLWRLITGGLLGAILFYLITNTASWLHDPGYPKTLAGWIQALTTGLPGYPSTWLFFRNTLLSGGIFTALFAGTMKLTARSESPQEKEAGVREEEPDPQEAPEEAKA